MKLDPSDIADLRPLINAAVFSTVEKLRADQAKLADRIGFVEREAAELLGIRQHCLRDARLRGEISARLVGRKYVYSRDALLRFLEGRR